MFVEFTVPDTERQYLAELSSDHFADIPPGSQEAFMTKIGSEMQADIATGMPRTIEALKRVDQNAALVMEFQEPEEVPPTPEYYQHVWDAPTYASDLPIAIGATTLGQPFGVLESLNGTVITDVFPQADKLGTRGATHSDKEIADHTEYAQRPDAGLAMRNLLLYCLRSPLGEGGETILRAPDLSQLSPAEVQILSLPIYHFTSPEQHVDYLAEAFPVIYPYATDRGETALGFRFNRFANVSERAAHDKGIDETEAVETLEDFKALLTDPNTGRLAHEWKPGQLVVVNNRKTTHARAAFTANADNLSGNRWLRRMFTGDPQGLENVAGMVYTSRYTDRTDSMRKVMDKIANTASAMAQE